MDRLAKAILTVVALALGFQLFIPPIVGLANNGDYPKVTGAFELDLPKEDDFKFLVRQVPIRPTAYWVSGFYSSEILLAGAAGILNRITTKPPVFDIRWMGAVHLGLWLWAIAMVLPAICALPRRGGIVVGAAIVFLLTDAMYATYFNSFYMEPGAIVFLALSIGFYVRSRWSGHWIDSFGLLAASLLLVNNKPQHALLCAPVAGLLAWHFWNRWSKWMAIGSAIVVLAGGLFSFTKGAPPAYAPMNVFNVIFMKILPRAADVGQELQQLGLNDSYRPYIGTFSYWEDSPMLNQEFNADFGRRTSHTRILWLYLTHPARAYRALREALDESGHMRPTLGNFDRSAGFAEHTETHAFTLSSGLKRALLEGRGPRYLFFFLLLGVALVWASPDRAGAFCLFITGLMAMLIAGLGDAVDHARHFALFHAIVDMMIVCAIAVAGRRWSMRPRA